MALPAFFFCSCSPECVIAGLFTVPTTASATLINISKTFFFSFFLPQHTCFLGLVPIPITGRKEMPISISLLIWSLKCGYETLETGTL